MSAGPWDPEEQMGGVSEGEAGGEVPHVMGRSGGHEAAVEIWLSLWGEWETIGRF